MIASAVSCGYEEAAPAAMLRAFASASSSPTNVSSPAV